MAHVKSGNSTSLCPSIRRGAASFHKPRAWLPVASVLCVGNPSYTGHLPHQQPTGRSRRHYPCEFEEKIFEQHELAYLLTMTRS